MSEKPNLTLKTALEHFPKECEAISKYVHEFDFLVAYPNLCEDGAVRLAYAALQWLAGKRRLHCFFYLKYGKRGRYWPPDCLRSLLEEVRAHLKQEKEG